MRPGEWPPVLLLQAQIFLIIAVLLIAKPVGNALFLNRFGAESLPYAYILTAVVAAVISSAYAAAMKYFSVLRVNLWSLGICILLLLTFVLMIPYRYTQDVVAVGLYLWVALFGVLAASQFWTIASLVFDLRQAKRLFGPIGAGAIAGGIAGGYAASILAQRIGIRPLLIIAGAALLVVVGLTMSIWRTYVAPQQRKRRRREEDDEDEDDTEMISSPTADREKSGTTPSTGDGTTPAVPAPAVEKMPHQIIARSRHLLLLSAIIALSVITAKLVDYQFSALASARYGNADRLASFFGFWFSTFNVIGLVIQLVVTNRLVQRTGVSGVLSILPAGLGVGAVLMFFIPGLSTATFSRLVDGSLKQSLHRAGVEMLYLPIRKRVKNRIKTYIDVLIDSAAGGVGGLLLLLLVGYFGVSPEGIAPLVLIFSVLWLVCVLLEREEYLEAFREQLSHLRPKTKRKPLQSRHREVLSDFLNVLKEADLNGSVNDVLFVLDRTENVTGPEFREPIQRLLTHKAPAVRARALHSLAGHAGLELYEDVRPLLDDPHLTVRNAAMEYLVHHHLEETEGTIRERLAHADPEVAGTTLVELLQETIDNVTLRRRWKLDEEFNRRVRALGDLPPVEARKWRLQLVRAAGRSGTNQGDRLISRELKVYGEDVEMVRTAIIAAGESRAERWVLTLLDFLSEEPYRAYASAALAQYGNGLLRLLPEYLRDDVIDIHDLRRLPRVLRQLPRQRTISVLFLILDKYYVSDIETRSEAIRALNHIQTVRPQLSMPPKRVLRQIRREAQRYRTLLDLHENQSNLLDRKDAEIRRQRAGLLNVLRRRRDGSLERLSRLLGLYYPAQDIIPIFRGLRGEDPTQRVNALEFLDNLLDASHKRLVIPLLEFPLRQPAAAAYDRQIGTERLHVEEVDLFGRLMKKGDIRLRISILHVMAAEGHGRYDWIVGKARRSRYAKVREVVRRLWPEGAGTRVQT